MQTGSSVRVHRRKIFLGQAPWTILTPRPSGAVRLATASSSAGINLRADLASLEGLAHLLWASAFQDRARTAILFDLPFLIPNGAEPSSPIVLVNSTLGIPSAQMLAELKAQLPLSTPSEGTVRLRTAGLDRALADPKTFEAKARADEDALPWDPKQWREWMGKESGVVMFAAPAPVLRAYALATAELGSFSWESLDSTEALVVDEDLQVFDQTIVKRAAALRARRESLFPGRKQADLLGPERAQLWGPTALRS